MAATLQSIGVMDLNDIVQSPDFDAAVKAATEDEHKLSIIQAIRRYPTAVFWTVAISFSIVMEGYDTLLLTSFFALPQFTSKFGFWLAREHEYTLSANWMIALVNTGNVGSLLGVSINGFVTERFGHRRVIMGGLLLMTGLIFIPFFAQSLPVLLTGGLLLGIPWGIFAIMGGSYASEVCPLVLRGSLTSFVAICWTAGQLISAAVVQGCDTIQSDYAYRIPFAVQWIWVPPLLVVALFAPDSPAWLVRKGRLADAEKSMRRLAPGLTQEQVKLRLATLVHTDRLEKATSAKKASFFECFRGTNLRRTEVACMSWATQSMCGSLLAYSGTYFLVQDGLSAIQAYKLNTGSKAVNVISTFIGITFVINMVGRRKAVICGLIGMMIVNLIIGLLSIPVEQHNVTAIWAQGSMTLVLMAITGSLIGPPTFTLSAEVSATRLRSQTLSIARFFYSIVSIIDGVINTWTVNPAKYNIKGKAGYVWVGIASLALLWAVFRLPETKDRTFEELDILFERRISARKFRSARVDQIADTHQVGEDDKKHGPTTQDVEEVEFV